MNATRKALIKGSFILLVTLNLFGLMNFFFQFSMARMLSLVDYGILATLFAMVYILSILSESIQLVLTKFTSLDSNSGGLKNLIKRSLRKSTQYAALLYLFFLILTFFLSPLLKIPFTLLALTGLMIFAVFFNPIPRGILHGRKQFAGLGLSFVLEGGIKLGLAVFLVFIGLKVYGAVAATLLSVLVAFAFSFVFLRDVLKSDELRFDARNIYQYSTPVFIITFVVVAFISIDIIIAKMVFEERSAGAYAVASILSKIIFFSTQPISKAMFPITAEKHFNKHSRGIFLRSLVILVFIILVALLVFYLFPLFVINIFSGRVIEEAMQVLPLLAAAAALVSITNLVILYGLSRGNTRHFKFYLLILIIEVVLMYLVPQTINQFAWLFVCLSAAFLLLSILLFEK